MTAAPAIACLQRMPSRPMRNGLAHLGSASLCSVQQPACAMRRTVCRLRAITAAVTYVTQPISWKPRKSSGVLGYASGETIAGNIILTPIAAVGSGWPQRGSNPGPLHQESVTGKRKKSPNRNRLRSQAPHTDE